MNFVGNQQRIKQRQAMVSLDALENAGDSEIATFEDERFTQEWAEDLVWRAINLVREDCYSTPGQEQIWQVFEARAVAPARSGEAVETYGRLAKRLRIASPKQATNRLRTALGMLRSVLRELVLGYLPADARGDEKQINEEIAELLRDATVGDLHVLGKVAKLSDEPRLSTNRCDFTCHADDLWNDSDYGGIWVHLTTIPLDEWVREFDPSMARRFEEVTIWVGHPMGNVAQLWSHPKPPIELLQCIKSYAKSPQEAASIQVGNGLPTIINAVLYHCSIALADLRHECRISRSSNRSFLNRLKIILGIEWLDDSTRTLLESWRSRLA